jgi:hypothetical protein
MSRLSSGPNDAPTEKFVILSAFPAALALPFLLTYPLGLGAAVTTPCPEYKWIFE